MAKAPKKSEKANAVDAVESAEAITTSVSTPDPVSAAPPKKLVFGLTKNPSLPDLNRAAEKARADLTAQNDVALRRALAQKFGLK